MVKYPLRLMSTNCGAIVALSACSPSSSVHGKTSILPTIHAPMSYASNAAQKHETTSAATGLTGCILDEHIDNIFH